MGFDDFDSYDYEEYEDDDEFYGIWTTSKGEEIKVTDMETSHLKNTIKYLRSQGREDSAACKQMSIELLLRGEKLLSF